MPRLLKYTLSLNKKCHPTWQDGINHKIFPVPGIRKLKLNAISQTQAQQTKHRLAVAGKGFVMYA